jgi:hypothetical protein
MFLAVLRVLRLLRREWWRNYEECHMSYMGESSSQSHIDTDSQSVSVGVEPHLGLMIRY